MKEPEINRVLESLTSGLSSFEFCEESANVEMSSALKDIAVFYEQEKAKEIIELSQLELTLKPLITKVQSIIEEETENRINKKDRFNVFECLTRHHLEELHSRFLAYLLDPNATHDCGDLFLELFINTIKENPDIAAEFHGNELDLTNAKLKREKFLGRSNDTDFYGFIDIFIATNEFDIVIENKIGAPEQDDQIYRYINFCKEKNRQHIALYLTLDGSISDQAGNEKYFCISYDETINCWLNKCKDSVEKYPLVNSGIKFYQKLLNEKILHKSSNTITMEIKDLLLKEENKIIIKYLPEIVNAQEPICDHLRKEFFKQTISSLKTKYNLLTVAGIIQKIQSSQIWDDEGRGMTFIDPKFVFPISDSQKIHFCIEHNYKNLFVGLFGIIYENGVFSDRFLIGKSEISDKIESIMHKKCNLEFENKEDYWLLRKFFYPNNDEFSFGCYELDYKFATEMDKIIVRFIEEVETFLIAWESTIKELQSK